MKIVPPPMDESRCRCCTLIDWLVPAHWPGSCCYGTLIGRLVPALRMCSARGFTWFQRSVGVRFICWFCSCRVRGRLCFNNNKKKRAPYISLHASTQHARFATRPQVAPGTSIENRPKAGIVPPPGTWYEKNITYGVNSSLNKWFYGVHLEHSLPQLRWV